MRWPFPLSPGRVVVLVLGAAGIPLLFKAHHPVGYLTSGELALCVVALAVWSQIVAWVPAWKMRGDR